MVEEESSLEMLSASLPAGYDLELRRDPATGWIPEGEASPNYSRTLI
jgi:hypothetical protein